MAQPTEPAQLQNNNEWRMTDAQREKLWALCGRYDVPFREDDYVHNSKESAFMPGWVEGWVGGEPNLTIYVGVAPDGSSHS